MPEKKKISNERSKKDTRSRAKKTEFSKSNWNQEDFLNYCEINAEVVEKTKMNWEELATIHDDHCAQIKQLDTVSKYIAERLREMPQIHSVRSRVKDSKHLIRKILRKKIEDESRAIRLIIINKKSRT